MNILVPVDFSDVTSALLEQASKLGKAFGGKIILLHAVPPDPDFVGYEVGPEHIREHLAKQFHEEHRQVQALGKELSDQGLEVTSLLVQGPTVEMILEEANKLEIGQIIMGSHGHGALHHMLLGSISEGVLKKAPCPILFVPAAR